MAKLPKLTIVDYGMGNLRSVAKAFEHVGASVRISSSAKDIIDAERLVVPGVGAFGDAVKELHHRGLFDALKHYLQTGRPFLGICLGLQLLFQGSEESPHAEGLGFFEARIRQFPPEVGKIPHMGWNTVTRKQIHPVLQAIQETNAYFYFVHSYYCGVECPKIVLGETEYGPVRFASIVGRHQVVATQFHPEKSQQNGLKLLENFLHWD